MRPLIKPLAVGFLVILLAGVLVFSKGSASAPATSSTPMPSTGSQNSSYTQSDISKHADAKSCWSTINGGVYDLTGWIDKHPGGREAILSICGKDGSAAFNAQHGDAQLQQQILASYKIGVLTK